MIGASPVQLERCLDAIRDPAFQTVFVGTLKERREDCVNSLIETGNDEFRFKVQMIDEILGFEEEIYENWKAAKAQG